MRRLPKCCEILADGAGGYKVGHDEKSPQCKHTPSGGNGGYPDGVTPCNRIVGHGKTKTAAVDDAIEHLSD